MDWVYGLGALLFGSGSLYFFIQQVFVVSLISFVIAIYLVCLFEADN